MSHITSIKTQIGDLTQVKRALVHLGLKYEEDGLARLWSKTKKCPIVITGDRYDIGVIADKDGKNPHFVADTMAFSYFTQLESLKPYFQGKGINVQDRFNKILTQTASLTNLIILADQRKADVEWSTPDEDGTIHARVTERVKV